MPVLSIIGSLIRGTNEPGWLHGGCSSQELVPHQKSRGHHPAWDRAEVVPKADFASAAGRAEGGAEGPPLQLPFGGSCTLASALSCLL